jgi:hypothetical protein
MNKKKLITISFIYSIILIFSSCGPNNIEDQVQQLIESNDTKERTEIAYSLADSLDTKASKLLLDFHSTTKSKKYLVINALEEMLKRYSEITSTHLDKCISSITDPDPQHSISNKEKISFIVNGLMIKSSSTIFQQSLAKSINNHGKYGIEEIIKKWNKNKSSKELFYAISLYPDQTIEYLSEKMVDDKDAIQLLARIGEPVVNIMKQKMRNSNQSIRFAAGDVLVEMLKYHPDAITNLTSAIDKNGVRTIARNYPFYIRLGQPGSETILLKALRQNFSTSMCVDYLNCGSKMLENGATNIARINGYKVTSGFMGHSGPRWGSGN